MGKCMRKCKGIGEIAVMEVAHVGVRTRTQALPVAAAASAGTAKKRKVGGAELKFSSSLAQLRSRRRLVVTPGKLVSAETSSNSARQTVSNDRSSSSSSDHLPASCCSSNASSELVKERFKIVDLEESSVQIETSPCDLDCRERRETTPSSELRAESGDLESTARPLEANSRHRSSAEKMPSDTELEEFFSAAENDLQKRFSDKYNYDIVKDVPLQGRYEWVPLKP